MKKRYLPLYVGLALAIFVGMLGLNSIGFGQERINYRLGEIVVVAGKILDNPYSELEIKAADLNRKSGQSIGDALKFVPGFFIRSGRKNELGFYLRGFQQREVVILLDGHPIYEPYFGTMDLGQLVVDDVAKMKITKGPASSLYGPNAMGGVINIITQSPQNTPLFAVSADAGNGNYRHMKVVHANHFGKLAYRINYSRIRSTGFPLSSKFVPNALEDGGLRNHSDFAGSFLSARFDWTPIKNTILDFSSGWLKSQKGIPPSTSDHPRFWDFPDWQRGYLDFSIKHKYSQRVSLITKVYGDWFRNTLIAFKTNDYQARKWTSTYNNRVAGAMLLGSLHSRKIGDWQGVLHLKEDVVHIQNNSGLPWETFEALTNSVGIQGTLAPSAFLSFLVGTSLDQLADKNNHSIVSLNPQIGMVYRISNRISIRALAGKKSRFPTLKEWYGSLYGNQLLKPEQTLSTEVGLRYENPSQINFQATYFLNDVKNLISQKSRHAPFENIDAARISGIEFTNGISISKKIAISLSYTYLSAMNRANRAQLPFRPKQEWSVQLNGNIPALGELFLDVLYTGKRRYEDYGKEKKLNPYTVINVGMSFRKWHSFAPYLQVLNALDAYYEAECGFPAPGREIRAGISFTPAFGK